MRIHVRGYQLDLPDAKPADRYVASFDITTSFGDPLPPIQVGDHIEVPGGFQDFGFEVIARVVTRYWQPLRMGWELVLLVTDAEPERTLGAWTRLQAEKAEKAEKRAARKRQKAS